MSQFSDLVLEGSYLYYEKDSSFSEENFKFFQSAENQSFSVKAEVLSRVESGELLKILINYEMDNHFHPLQVKIERSIGNMYSQELYRVDSADQQLYYTFQNSEMTQEFTRSISTKHYIAAPAVSTSAFFTLSKKFDATGRTPINFISTDNEWTYTAPPTEKIVYAEYKFREASDFKLDGATLPANQLCLYEFDSMNSYAEQPVDLFLSKHYSLPYQMSHGNQKIIIKKLKKHAI